MDYKGLLKRFVPDFLIHWTRPMRQYFEAQRRFDRRFGVDTSGMVEQSELGIDVGKIAAAAAYGATPRPVFFRILKSLPVRYERFTFVDLGSGKGAVLLYAAELPFKKVIGVELSPGLHRIAERNIAGYRGKRIKCNDVESVCADAAAYALPLEPTIIFLFNPFRGRTPGDRGQNHRLLAAGAPERGHCDLLPSGRAP
jgi:SAM-dependent methyltransferase